MDENENGRCRQIGTIRKIETELTYVKDQLDAMKRDIDGLDTKIKGNGGRKGIDYRIYDLENWRQAVLESIEDKKKWYHKWDSRMWAIILLVLTIFFREIAAYFWS